MEKISSSSCLRLYHYTPRITNSPNPNSSLFLYPFLNNNVSFPHYIFLLSLPSYYLHLSTLLPKSPSSHLSSFTPYSLQLLIKLTKLGFLSLTCMDEYGGSSSRFEGMGNTVRRKRTQTSRRPRLESQPLNEGPDRLPLLSTPSDDENKLSSDETNGPNPNSKRKLFNLNQCDSRDLSATRAEGDYLSKKFKTEDVGSDVLCINEGSGDGVELGAKQSTDGAVGLGNESKLKKVKLKVGGVTRTIQTKSSSHVVSASRSSTKSARSSDVPRESPKLIVQEDSDEDRSPKCGLQGIPWKDFSTGGFTVRKEESVMGKSAEKAKQGDKSAERVRKSKRVPKKRALDEAFDEDEDDDEIRYLEKIKISKLAAGGGSKDIDEESSLKHRSLSRVSKGGIKSEIQDDFGSTRSAKDGKKSSRLERGSEDVDYEEDQRGSDGEAGGGKEKQRKDRSDSPGENRREMTLTTRQRALLSGKDASASGAAIEFPNGLPQPAPRKQKEKLTEVEQQLKKAEAAERRRLQNEKAARESEAEAIRKILGQDSSRKKREDKMKKRKEEIAQEKAANAHMITPNTVRYVMGPQGTVVTFSNDLGLPHIFDSKPCSYPLPREKCAGPSCTNPYKYRDSKSKLPLCSLQCYKAIREMDPITSC